MSTNTTSTISGDQTNRAQRIVAVEPDQLSAAQYRFRREGNRMFGMVISSGTSGRSELPLKAIDQELRKELAMWDALSDEALLDFEDAID